MIDIRNHPLFIPETNWFITNTYDNLPYPTPPAFPGLYALYSLNLDTTGKKILYIGTSDNLKKRLSTHSIALALRETLRYPEILLTKIKLIGDDYKRCLLEQVLIQKLKPPMNKLKYPRKKLMEEFREYWLNEWEMNG